MPPESTPVVVLVRPQLAVNVGMAARAMLNCGLRELRLVAPQCRWPDQRAAEAATAAAPLVEAAHVHARIEDAVADCHLVFATCPRRRAMAKPVIDHRACAARLRAAGAAGERAALLFGPERTGLENDELMLADTHVAIPLNPDFESLNLAHAVLVTALAWWEAAAPPPVPPPAAALAPKAELHGFLDRLIAELDSCGFLRNAAMRPQMVQNIRAVFHRAELRAHEVRTLHGIVTCLTRRPHAAAAAPPPESGTPPAAPPGRAD